MKTLWTDNSIKSQKLNGKARIHDYCWDYAHSGGVKPDPTGPDTPYVNDGLLLTGDRPLGADMEIKQVAGTALVMSPTPGTTARVRETFIESAIYGIRVDATDARLRDIDLENIVKTAVTVNGGGNTRLYDIHPWGGDQGFVFNSRIIGFGLYVDNLRNGMVFTGDSHGSTVCGLPILDCWEKSIVLAANGINLSQISGKVPASTAEHPNPIGVWFGRDTCHQQISGWAFIGEGGVGYDFAGERNTLGIHGGGWNAEQNRSVVCRLTGIIRNGNISIKGFGNGGCVVDASGADLDSSTDIDIAWGGSAIPFIDGKGSANVRIRKAA